MIRVTITHAAAMAALHGSAFPQDPWDAASFTALLGQPGMAGLIDPRGGVILFRMVADEAEIITLAVAVKRQGIGTALVHAAIEHIAAKGVKILHLEVAAGNLAARALYKSCGFQENGRRKAYYADGQDAILLARDLSLSPSE